MEDVEVCAWRAARNRSRATQVFLKVALAVSRPLRGRSEFFVVVRVDCVHTHHNKKLFGAIGPGAYTLRIFERT